MSSLSIIWTDVPLQNIIWFQSVSTWCLPNASRAATEQWVKHAEPCRKVFKHVFIENHFSRGSLCPSPEGVPSRPRYTTRIMCTVGLWSVLAKATSELNPSPPGQNGRHFADDIFICIFVNEKFGILIKISLKFVPRGPVDNNPALVYNGFAPNRWHAIIWTNADPIHWRIYAAPEGDELIIRIIVQHSNHRRSLHKTETRVVRANVVSFILSEFL